MVSFSVLLFLSPSSVPLLSFYKMDRQSMGRSAAAAPARPLLARRHKPPHPRELVPHHEPGGPCSAPWDAPKPVHCGDTQTSRSSRVYGIGHGVRVEGTVETLQALRIVSLLVQDRAHIVRELCVLHKPRLRNGIQKLLSCQKRSPRTCEPCSSNFSPPLAKNQRV